METPFTAPAATPGRATSGPRPRGVIAGFRRLAAALMVLFMVMPSFAASPPGGAPQRRDGPMRIVVSIPPLLWAVKHLAPADASITLLVPPGASEHGAELTPSQAAAIHSADVVVMVGLGLEPRVKSILDAGGPAWRQVVTFDGLPGVIRDEASAGHDHDHAHAPGEPCDHGAIDPHAWLDPEVMGAFVERVSAALNAEPLRGALPASAAPDPGAVRAAAERLRAECRAIDDEYRRTLAAAPARTIVTHHNAFEYVARRYGLRVAAVIRPLAGVEPTPGEVDRALRAVREGGLRAVFVEPQFPAGAAERIARAAGPRVKTITLDPLGDGDWPTMMRKNLAGLAEGLGGSAP